MEDNPYFTAGLTPAKPTPKPPVARISAQDQKMLEGIRLHSAVPKEGIVSMSDSRAGNGVKAGRNIEGWNLHSINQDGNSVVMERNGAFFTMPIQGSAPTEYKAPDEKVDKQKISSGNMTDKERELGENVFTGDPTPYALSDEAFKKIKENSIQSPYMSDAAKASIMHYDEYMQKAGSGQLEKNRQYYIPRIQEDGNVDFDIFTHE